MGNAVRIPHNKHKKLKKKNANNSEMTTLRNEKNGGLQ